MAKNGNLNNAKAVKNDEFYTQLDDIAKEIVYYRPHFEGKKVLCNCNDALHTGFAKFFSLQFEILGLKELICTSFAMEEGGHGVVYRYKGDKNGNNVPDIDEWEQTPMHGNGGFNTPEGLALIDEADIVVTNPPFSLFREFISVMIEHGKKFLVIGNLNAVTYNEVFPFLRDNEMWMGATYFNGGATHFIAPSELYDPDKMYNEKNAFFNDKGEFMWRVNGVRWFTNLDHKKRHEEVILYKKYNEEEYPKYDNYDAINVNKVCDIPLDYNSAMGVPVSFVDKFCPEQFEIIDRLNSPVINGKSVYKRLIIRFKK